MDTQLIKRVPVYVDSPMAMRALELYRQAIETSSPEVQSAIAAAYSTSDPFNTGTHREVASVEESKKLNDPHQPCIIISASGMATGGRVVHHLRGMLPDPDNTVILVGFQAAGTRGRSLADGAKFLKMFGNYIPVRADVVQVGSFSVHADTDELLGWLERAEFDPKIVYVVHGEISAADEFAERICRDLNWCAVVPRDGEKVVL
jgi:metallo-beta-lactamase family protein